MSEAQSIQEAKLAKGQAVPIENKKKGKSFKEQLNVVLAWIKLHPKEFGFSCFAIGSFLFLFWPLFDKLPYVWFNDNSYYAHGPVVPFFVAIIIWDRLAALKEAKMKGVGWAIIPIIPLLYLTWFIMRTGAYALQSLLLITLLLLSFLYILGWKFTKLLTIPTLFLAFGLPVFDRLIDAYSPPIQVFSSKVAFHFFHMLPDITAINVTQTEMALNNFVLDVELGCSGMKLLLAVVAITCFFAIIAKMNWWRTTLLIAAAIPIAVAVNCIRIITVGLIGVYFGSADAAQLHDPTGYASLVLCFLILLKYTKVLGWK